MKKFFSVGGQYNQIVYGSSDSLRGARLISARHDEFCDNWQGWHRPKVCVVADGEFVPVSAYDFTSHRWYMTDGYGRKECC